MAISKNAMIAIVAVVVVVIAAAAAVVLMNNNNNDKPSNPALLEGAKLKVLGNADGDMDIDNNDVSEIEKIIKDNGTAEKYPLADANNDSVIDSKDVDLVKSIINYKAGDSQIQIWNVNYEDHDQTGTMKMELVSTMYPITSTIMTGSANSFMLMYLLGIIDEVKGASYGSSNDTTLFGSNYLDKTKVEQLGTSSTSITFEDGKAGSSDVIKTKNVTALVTDWNRTYITNEADFEKGNVDVVRVAAASVDKETYTHSILVLGFLFQKEATAQKLLALYDKCADLIEKNKSDGSVKAVASSMASVNKYAYISSKDSDYTAVLLSAGMSFAVEGYNFGGSTSIDTYKNLDLYDTSKYTIDYIVHIRTNVGYGGYTASTLKGYTDAFCKYYQYTNGEHQYIVSGVIPVPLRVLYTESIFSSSLSVDDVNSIHQEFITGFFANKNIDLSKISFFVNGSSLYSA